MLEDRPLDSRVSRLVDGLAEIRAFRSDISDDIWILGLRVVMDSVRLHSAMSPGETTYLEFAGEFQP